MYVGVILDQVLADNDFFSIPHVCGGDPKDIGVSNEVNMYSPCMWGWSLLLPCHQPVWLVFPMYVGVILSDGRLSWAPTGIPHVCGGDPQDRFG